MTISAEAGDLTWTMRATDRIIERFEVDPLQVKAKSLAMLSKSVPAAGRRELVDVMLSTAADATRHEQYKMAKGLLDLARNLSRNLRDKELTATIMSRMNAVNEMEDVQRAAAAAETKLAANPDDHAAATIAGKYWCFIKRDWEKGVAVLSEKPRCEISRNSALWN